MFERMRKLPSPEEILTEMPLSERMKATKRERDEKIKAVLKGETRKLLLILGPCSAHDEKAVIDYVGRLARLNERIENRLVLIPRIYTSKPRTRGVGYMGMLFRPDPDGTEDLAAGIRAARRLHLLSLEESGLTAADELYPESFPFLEDLLGYAAVGARSCEDPTHRFLASGAESAVGFKNPTSGNVSALINSVYAAQREQTFAFGGWQVRTTGNPFAHMILRGRVDWDGTDVPNYDRGSVMRVGEGAIGAELQNPAVIVDVNHSNSGKKYEKQKGIAEEILNLRREDPKYGKLVKGFMIESFLEEGSQPRGVIYGKSITDPCLGWAETERLVSEIAEKV